MGDLVERLRDYARVFKDYVEPPFWPTLGTEAADEIERLEAQLPDGMKHCTIQFIECQNGHGRLTATNWVPHECHWCEIERLQCELEGQRDITDREHAEAERLRSEAEWHTDATREIERMRVWLQKIVAIDPYLPEAEQYTPATQMAQWARCALAGQEPPPANIVREPGYVDPDF